MAQKSPLPDSLPGPRLPALPGAAPLVEQLRKLAGREAPPLPLSLPAPSRDRAAPPVGLPAASQNAAGTPTGLSASQRPPALPAALPAPSQAMQPGLPPRLPGERPALLPAPAERESVVRQDRASVAGLPGPSGPLPRLPERLPEPSRAGLSPAAERPGQFQSPPPPLPQRLPGSTPTLPAPAERPAVPPQQQTPALPQRLPGSAVARLADAPRLPALPQALPGGERGLPGASGALGGGGPLGVQRGVLGELLQAIRGLAAGLGRPASAPPTGPLMLPPVGNLGGMSGGIFAEGYPQASPSVNVSTLGGNRGAGGWGFGSGARNPADFFEPGRRRPE